MRTIAELARSLGIAVAAEGVESAAQLERLLALGCDTAQGYYFARPGSQADVESHISGARDPDADAVAV